jgi:ABC-type amino acid transport substrate-binding protein
MQKYHHSKRRQALGRIALGVAGLAAPAVLRAADAPLQVIYPPPSSASDARASYYIELLGMVMRKSGLPFEMRAYDNKMVGARVVQALEENQSVTVSWIGRQEVLDERLLPIKRELDHGILGTRLMLIRERDREAFGRIRTIDQLRNYSAGQQRDWIDTRILRANGLPVVPAALYGSLFDMLAAGRFDYYPRGAVEIWDELRQFGKLGLIVEPTLALRYPFVTWFYVSRKNPALAQALEKGLQTAQADGSMERLFDRYNGDALRRARLSDRTVFDLHS